MYDQQTESDEDCEVYFLKPVNEYNITEKIKEANKELFAEFEICSANETLTASIEKDLGTATIVAHGTAYRKVTFAPNLEDYEPDESGGTNNTNLDDDEEESHDMDPKTHERQKTNYQFPTIDEEETLQVTASQIEREGRSKLRASGSIERQNQKVDKVKEEFVNETLITTTNIVMDRISEIQEAMMSSLSKDYDFQQTAIDSADKIAVEEICEEIIVMDMEENAKQTSNARVLNASMSVDKLGNDGKEQRSQQLQRCITKQATFDYYDEGSDNRSLTNLITSDYEEDDEEEMSFSNTNNTQDCVDDDFGDCDEDIYNDDIDYSNSDIDNALRNNNNDNNHRFDEANATDDNNDVDEDDDDDRLSIIVASYLPKDFETPKARSREKANTNNKDNQNKVTTPQHSSKSCRNKATSAPKVQATSTSRKSPFGKGFTLRRKSHSTNSIGACVENEKTQRNSILNGICSSSSKHYTTFEQQMKQSVSTTTMLVPDEITDLKLNYKTCCEYRNSVQEKLPKYTGYLSEYGLSREQLEEREHKQMQKHRFTLQKTLKTSEHEMRRMQDNERAFTTWLKNKMRFPINKTRNMFDAKHSNTNNKNNNNNNNSNNNNNNGPIAFRKRYFSSNKTK